MMKDKFDRNELYDEICEALSCMPPETGGILGRKNGKITCFYYDSAGSRSENCYIPDVDVLNQQILNWKKNNIEFAGIVHSHWENEELSAQDFRYGRQIARAFGRDIVMGVYVYYTKKLFLYDIFLEK